MSVSLAITFSSVGWLKFSDGVSQLKTSKLPHVVAVLNQALHLKTDMNEHLLYWDDFNSYGKGGDVAVAMDWIDYCISGNTGSPIPWGEFYAMRVYKTHGTVDVLGRLYNGPNIFDIKAVHRISYKVASNMTQLLNCGIGVPIGTMSVPATPTTFGNTWTGGTPAAKAPVAPAINNYTCKGCGNKKCNTSEKKCWICEAEIKP